MLYIYYKQNKGSKLIMNSQMSSVYKQCILKIIQEIFSVKETSLTDSISPDNMYSVIYNNIYSDKIKKQLHSKLLLCVQF